MLFQNSKINRALASSISAGMKEWAISKGVTHYTHWFKPLSGSTAENMIPFTPLESGFAIERFSVMNWCNKNQMLLVFQQEVKKYI